MKRTKRVVIAKVTYTAGAYIARGGGKAHSSTTSNYSAARGLADKLGFSASADVAFKQHTAPDRTVFDIVEVQAGTAGARAECGCAPRGGAHCRKCGCTDLQACAGGCWWVEPDLCSSCAPPRTTVRAAKATGRRP